MWLVNADAQAAAILYCPSGTVGMMTSNSYPVVSWLTSFLVAISRIFHFAPSFIWTAYIADTVKLSRLWLRLLCYFLLDDTCILLCLYVSILCYMNSLSIHSLLFTWLFAYDIYWCSWKILMYGVIDWWIDVKIIVCENESKELALSNSEHTTKYGFVSSK